MMQNNSNQLLNDVTVALLVLVPTSMLLELAMPGSVSLVLDPQWLVVVLTVVLMLRLMRPANAFKLSTAQVWYVSAWAVVDVLLLVRIISLQVHSYLLALLMSGALAIAALLLMFTPHDTRRSH